jgi:hypothetical protein
MPKAGYRTTEFITIALTIIGVLAGALQGSVPPKYAALFDSVLAGLYAVLRTFLKDSAAKNTPTPIAVVTPTLQPPATPTTGS